MDEVIFKEYTSLLCFSFYNLHFNLCCVRATQTQSGDVATGVAGAGVLESAFFLFVQCAILNRERLPLVLQYITDISKLLLIVVFQWLFKIIYTC